MLQTAASWLPQWHILYIAHFLKLLINHYFFESVSIMSPLTEGLAPITHVAIILFITIETVWVNRGWVGGLEETADTCTLFYHTRAENPPSEIICICLQYKWWQKWEHPSVGLRGL